MKFKFKVARIEQRPVQKTDGSGTEVATLVKLIPVDAPAGDVLLHLPGAEVTFHPEKLEDHPHPQMAGMKYATIKKDHLMQSAKVGGETIVLDQVYTLEVTPAT